MLKSITRILPFLIVTLLCIGGVELFYGLAEHYLVIPEEGGKLADSAGTVQKQFATSVKKHSNFDIIVERNLFQSYIKEQEPVETVKENPLEGLETTTLDLVLMGTITGKAGRSRAIILEKAKRKQEIYYQGDVIQGAEIKEILRGKVILGFQGKDEILDMSEAAKMKPKASPVAVSPVVKRRRVVAPPQINRKQRPVPEEITKSEPQPSAIELEQGDDDTDRVEDAETPGGEKDDSKDGDERSEDTSGEGEPEEELGAHLLNSGRD